LPGGRPKIKNRVIEVALSDAWLNQIAVSNKGRLDVASEHFDAGRYSEAIKLIEEYLQFSSADQVLPLASRFHLGVACYFVRNYDVAVKELRIALDGDLNEEVRATCKFYLASSLLRRGSAAESIEYFRDASKYSGRLRDSAKLALAA
jgi:tetratricopeptide (TPR) repeat protein